MIVSPSNLFALTSSEYAQDFGNVEGAVEGAQPPPDRREAHKVWRIDRAKRGKAYERDLKGKSDNATDTQPKR